MRFGKGQNTVIAKVAPDDMQRGTIFPELVRDAGRQAKMTVSNFAGLNAFIRGTDMLVTRLEYMHLSSLRVLSMATLPFETEPVGVFMVWHYLSQ